MFKKKVWLDRGLTPEQVRSRKFKEHQCGTILNIDGKFCSNGASRTGSYLRFSFFTVDPDTAKDAVCHQGRWQRDG